MITQVFRVLAAVTPPSVWPLYGFTGNAWLVKIHLASYYQLTLHPTGGNAPDPNVYKYASAN
ncbi:hypothetical protein [Bradyrhizobium sp.]|uniref:hypothetical protein n=1 Tax=Bradyrhizobium sp. TaxID=376 RepID=UPI002632C5DA|nr:hypothetical protein [Bradyrhizobium sp.]